ncbi:MAG: GxxExxY protein [Gammaproteobacteria bacterium SHHR-1]|uniref:GxxExxY protein n=1 Tax=Magnetovirga frankeli TaxID=947516 RepID=UPI001292CDA5|nr:GxxExxY protein [gamma proteobacterium SS-5]
MDENLLTDQIIGAAIEVHKSLGPGLLESSYQQCLAREFDLRQIAYQREKPLQVSYKGILIEQAYRSDFVVGERVIVEIKAVDCIEPVHRAQVLTYLKWSTLKLGLLLNFNVRLMKSGIHRIVNKL